MVRRAVFRNLVSTALAVTSFVLGTPLGADEPADEKKAWCAPGLDVLSNDVCFHAQPPNEGRRTLVIFLHGLVQDGAGWQHNQQLGIIRGGKRLGFSVITPRGVTGISRHGADMVAWPTGVEARQAHEATLHAQWRTAIDEAEAKIGQPFDEVFAVGFSNGAYYASSLLARAPFPIDGYGVFAGGMAYTPNQKERRSPVFVGICSKDSTAKQARELVDLLKKQRWPHKAETRKVGHAIADAHLDHALAYLREQMPTKKTE